MRPALLVLFGAVACVLIIACANVASQRLTMLLLTLFSCAALALAAMGIHGVTE